MPVTKNQQFTRNPTPAAQRLRSSTGIPAQILRDAYFGGAPTRGELGRYVIYKAMCDLLWTLWGLIQVADQNPVDDFWAYANRRFARCKKLMDSPEFPLHVENVERGEARQRGPR